MAGCRNIMSYLGKKPSSEIETANPSAEEKIEADREEKNKGKEIRMEQSKINLGVSPLPQSQEKKIRPMRQCVLSARSLKISDEGEGDFQEEKQSKGSKRKRKNGIIANKQMEQEIAITDELIVTSTTDLPEVPKRNEKNGKLKQLKLKNKVDCSDDQTEKQEFSTPPPSSKLRTDVKEASKIKSAKKLSLKKSPLKRKLIAENGSQEISPAKLSFNLREEAKQAAEENARLMAGKETHPFFMPKKLKLSQGDNVQMEADMPSLRLMEGELEPDAPFHITQIHQVDAKPLEWVDIRFMDSEVSECQNCNIQEENNIVINRRMEESLCGLPALYSFSSEKNSISYPNSRSLYKLAESANNKDTIKKLLENLVTYLEKQKSFENKFSTSPLSGSQKNLSTKDLEDRFFSYYHCRQIHEYSDVAQREDNLLWTVKYKPDTSSEVCGNMDSVTIIKEWLSGWQDSVSGLENGKLKGFSKEDYFSYSFDSDDSNKDIEIEATKNVMLLTGPVGCGKTAALYACAKEQDFDVIEVNASECRSGALVKQKFGEAVESRGLNPRFIDDFRGSQSGKLSLEQLLLGNKLNQEEDGLVNRTMTAKSLIASTMKNPLQSTYQKYLSSSDSKQCLQKQSKALILFEDVDTVFEEDRGFMATVFQFADVSKRPIVLTCNRRDPCLPRFRNKITVEFNLPTVEELIIHVFMVLMAENIAICPGLLEHIIRHCNNDLRKTMLLIQFWCQGNKMHSGGNQMSQTSISDLIELDIEHSIIPHLMPWRFPCKLSDTINTQISKALELETKMKLCKETMELKAIAMSISITNSKKRKTLTNVEKKALMLERACPVNDEMQNLTVVLDDDSNEIKFHRSSAMSHELQERRKRHVIASDSEDMSTNDTYPGFSESQQEVAETQFSVDSVDASDGMHQLDSDEPISSADFVGCEGVESFVPVFKRLKKMQDQDLVDLSYHSDTCEPECSFVPETQLNDSNINGDESCGLTEPFMMDTLKSNISSPSRVCQESDTNNILLNKKIENGQCNMNGFEKREDDFTTLKPDVNNYDSGHLDVEKVEDRSFDKAYERRAVPSFAKPTECTNYTLAASEGRQLLDECSRIDFNCANDESKELKTDNPVQEAWKKFYDCRESYKTLLSSECNDAMFTIDLASRMADVISSSDLLLSSSGQTDNDSPDFYDDLSNRSQSDLPSISHYEECMQMTSTYAQYGFYLAAKTCSEMSSRLGKASIPDLRKTILAASVDSLAKGKLIMDEENDRVAWHEQLLLAEPSAMEYCNQRERLKSKLSDILDMVVPAKLLCVCKGPAFHEYTSFLGKISSLEESRSSIVSSLKRRARGFRHYLATRPFLLPCDSISALTKHSKYGKVTEAKSEQSL